MSGGNSDLVDVTVRVHAETKLAMLVSDDGVEKNAVWLPRSQIEIAPAPGTGASRNIVLITAPEWLLIDKGLI
jgi:hypothetical protein